jgi:N-acetyl-gamma-glutamyl-phosphate reductase
MRVAVLGASGYAGSEVLRLLTAHPQAEVTYLGAKGSASLPLVEVHPHLGALRPRGLEFRPLEPDAEAADVVFSALPHGISAEIPLGWHGLEHPSPTWLEKAVYGLHELLAAARPGARLIANLGPFATPVRINGEDTT